MNDLKKLQNGSDIRGIAMGPDSNLKEEETKALTYGFVKFLKKRYPFKKLTISVGMDSRLSGPELKSYIISELTKLGCNVIDCGLASTPAMFMCNKYMETNSDASIMITASHLPQDRNGFKFFTKESGVEKDDITEIINYGLGYKNGINKGGKVTNFDLISLYSEDLKSKIIKATNKTLPLKGLHIVVDSGNGAGGFYATKVLEPLGCDISGSQFLMPDGTFPNHIPNPEDKSAMESISKAVKSSRPDLGLIFDTDVDRAACVDENGNEISRNKIVALAASLIKDNNNGTTIVTDSITSNELSEFLELIGLKHLRYMRGYRNVINKSIELNKNGIPSALAIETSGHAAYKENYFLDDGAYLATKIVIALANGTKISELLSGFKEPKEAMEVRIKVNSEDYVGYSNMILENFTHWAKNRGYQIVEPNYEGVRVNINEPYLKGWMLLRKSLHDPILPLNIEVTMGTTQELLEPLKTYLKMFDKLII